jgi:hypothetical protein
MGTFNWQLGNQAGMVKISIGSGQSAAKLPILEREG